MRNNILLLIITIAIFSCSNRGNQSQAEGIYITDTIAVEGMTCGGCEMSIENGLKEVDGMIFVKASHTSHQVIVSYDTAKTSINQILDRISETGYKPVY